MAFAADFETTNLFYVYYSAPSAAAASFNASLYDPTSSICGSESAYVDHVNILAEYKLDNITRVATYSPLAFFRASSLTHQHAHKNSNTSGDSQ